MKQCVIFGGGGYIGRNLALRLNRAARFDRIRLVDLAGPPEGVIRDGIEFVQHDVREPISAEQLRLNEPIEWIFHLAAVHREPGHTASEYFRTNLPSARHVANFADEVKCKNIFFTSSIAVYGPTSKATDETAELEPVSPYGISKLCSELILEKWLADDRSKRLVTARPGVIYGPGDPGNIGRLIQAVKRGRFVYPGDRNIRKSYGYIEGLLDSIEFVMGRADRLLTYNYVEKETLPLKDLVSLIAGFVGKANPKLSVPKSALEAAAHVIQIATLGKSPIHPHRVRKAAMQTWIVPQRLIDMGFRFNYDLASSLTHWNSVEPDFFTRRRG